MKTYKENNRLTIKAGKGKILTDGAELYVSKYAFPVGVEKNEILHEITEAEYNAILEAAAADMGIDEVTE